MPTSLNLEFKLAVFPRGGGDLRVNSRVNENVSPVRAWRRVPAPVHRQADLGIQRRAANVFLLMRAAWCGAPRVAGGWQESAGVQLGGREHRRPEPKVHLDSIRGSAPPRMS